MAIVKGGDKTMVSGKVDESVYVQLNGQTITRRAPRFKKESFTTGMRLNQQRFKEVNTFCAQFKTSVIPQIWNGTDKRMSGYALFLKSNMPAFGADGSMEDVKKIKLSTGKLPFPQGFEARRSEEDSNRIEVLWPKEMNVGGIHMKDELMVISAREGEYSDITATGITKEDLKGTFELPASTMLPAPRLPSDTNTGGQASPLHLYLFFASRDRRDYSESVCFEV